jgi:hypothetical protein
MFPRPESRFKTAFRRSLDAAIDFATLGEYGYAPAWEDIGADAASDGDWGFDAAWASPQGGVAASSRSAAGGPVRAGTGTATPELVPAASAAGRARRNAARRAAPACAGQPVRGRTLTPQVPRPARQRDGMAPREQVCAADPA